ncbi:hypothetical protein H2203_007387 [Taxawa tesnikishii (nom. ined.)]|nr:hypothetical protein H2203_007387 [Dothideales sp. JES 119]
MRLHLFLSVAALALGVTAQGPRSEESAPGVVFDLGIGVKAADFDGDDSNNNNKQTIASQRDGDAGAHTVGATSDECTDSAEDATWPEGWRASLPGEESYCRASERKRVRRSAKQQRSARRKAARARALENGDN